MKFITLKYCVWRYRHILAEKRYWTGKSFLSAEMRNLYDRRARRWWAYALGME